MMMMGIDRNGDSLACTSFISSIPSTSGIMISVKIKSTVCAGDSSASMACAPFIAVVTVWVKGGWSREGRGQRRVGCVVSWKRQRRLSRMQTAADVSSDALIYARHPNYSSHPQIRDTSTARCVHTSQVSAPRVSSTVTRSAL